MVLLLVDFLSPVLDCFIERSPATFNSKTKKKKKKKKKITPRSRKQEN